MIIICRTCQHSFKRKYPCNPKTLRVWNCPLKRCKGYGTIATFAESFHVRSGIYPANRCAK